MGKFFSGRTRRRKKRLTSRRCGYEALEAKTLLSAVPTGFTETQVAAAISSPTSLDIAHDGRVFVAQQNGVIRVIKNDVMLSQPFVNLTTDSSNEHGLLGIALDPNFDTNHYIYVFYTATGPAHMRLSRLIANGDTMQAGSEVVLVDFAPIPASGIFRMGGAIEFGPDGKIYLSVGDEMISSAPQSLNNPFGKILRLNTDGSIPTDNPFYNSTTGINRAIWAYGLRNPYTTAFQPGTGRFFINDVGQSSWEEIDEGFAGANFGWPTTEGAFNQAQHPNFTEPFYTYAHNSTNGSAITGGDFYNPTINQFPSEYVDKYFFADFTKGEIRTIDLDTKVVTVFATGANFPTNLIVASDGSLYYLSRGIGTGVPGTGTGQLFKITYGSTAAPRISITPADTLVSVGYQATFSVSATGASPFTYQWTRNGQPIANSNAPSYTTPATSMADNGAVYRVTITNQYGEVTSDAAVLSVTTTPPPTATILSPAAGTQYVAGDSFHFVGEGTDNQGHALAASQLVWEVDFQHNTHAHPFIPPTGDTTTLDFTIPTIGETSDNVWYRVYLTVTDSIGLSTTTFFDILPVKSHISLQTNIPGLVLFLDGQTENTPLNVTGVVGLNRELQAPLTQTVGGATYVFTSWSDGGASTHDISFPSADTVYTANYQPGSATYLSNISPMGKVTNGWGAMELNASNGEKKAGDGHPMSLDGLPYVSGLGVHANSTVTYDLGGNFFSFVSDIGVDDEVGSKGSVVFQVFADGTKIFDSGKMTGASPTQTVNLDVSGVNQLKLVVTNAGDGNANDHADWANAQLLGPPLPAAPNLSLPTSYGTGANAHGVVAADVNGDGILDLIVANSKPSTVSVLLGNGNGTFATAANYATGKTPKALKAGDVNGDGYVDLVTADQDSAKVSVLLNRGDGTFARPVDYTATKGAHDVVLADLDGDGDLDIATAGWGAKFVRVLLNQGNGTFAAGTNYAVGKGPHSVVAVDFNGDGTLDLAVADHDNGNVAVLTNKGNGTFNGATYFGVGTRPHSVRAGDLNGDGAIDLVTANDGSNNVSVLYGNGLGSFAKAVNFATGQTPKSVELGDINGDGRMDIIVGNVATNYPKGTNPAGMKISVLLATATGRFARALTYATGNAPFGIVLADFDNDGNLDLATANWSSNNVTVLLNNGVS